MIKEKQKFTRKYWAIGIVIISVLIVLAAWDVLKTPLGIMGRDFFYPYLSVLEIGTKNVSDKTLLLYNRFELASKVEELLAVNNQLEILSNEAIETRRENRELRNLLNLELLPNWNYISAEIILRDPLFWKEQFSVSCNNLQDVNIGNAVIAVNETGKSFFIGVIAEKGNRNAKVNTIYNSSLRMALKLSNNEIGVINYDNEKVLNGNKISIGLLPANTKYQLPQKVFTTGYERGIPGGLEVGNLVYLDNQTSKFNGMLHVSGALSVANIDNNKFLYIAVRRK